MKEEIIDTALKLFMKYGIRSVTMDDIARELSISKKTIYQHFADKDEIVSLAAENHLNCEMENMDEVNGEASNAIEELFLASKAMRSSFKNLNPAVLHDIKRFHKTAWNHFVRFKSEYIYNSVVKNLNKGIKEGYFRPEINVDILATFRVSQVELGFSDEVFPKDKFDFKEVQNQIFDNFVYGLLTDAGRKLYMEYQQKEFSYEQVK